MWVQQSVAHNKLLLNFFSWKELVIETRVLEFVF
jgi:hypothetical protein